CCGTSVSEPITEPSIREGMPVRCADECEVPRWRGVNDLLQVGMHRYRELGLLLMLHDGQEPLRSMLPPKADYIAPALAHGCCRACSVEWRRPWPLIQYWASPTRSISIGPRLIMSQAHPIRAASYGWEESGKQFQVRRCPAT